ncbi:PIN domain-containing protein [Elstera litoralis]|uniref:PIN domain-containing protein n=1 Tax=Elstera litoralis TaxID=552518 RepID=UPI002FC2BFA3
MESGIAKLRRTGGIQRAAALGDWLETLLHFYSGRVLPFDIPVARVAGLLSDHALSQGQAPGLADIAIAATAQHHRLTVLTRNLRHFEPLGIAVVDPFVRLPD